MRLPFSPTPSTPCTSARAASNQGRQADARVGSGSRGRGTLHARAHYAERPSNTNTSNTHPPPPPPPPPPLAPEFDVRLPPCLGTALKSRLRPLRTEVRLGTSMRTSQRSRRVTRASATYAGKHHHACVCVLCACVCVVCCMCAVCAVCVCVCACVLMRTSQRSRRVTRASATCVRGFFCLLEAGAGTTTTSCSAPHTHQGCIIRHTIHTTYAMRSSQGGFPTV
jgi:hypothetical protein